VAFAAAIVWYAAAALRGQWSEAVIRLSTLRISWPLVAFCSAIVVATYAVLIDAWRRVTNEGGDSLPFSAAARIWFVSNLGKYIPGKVWSIAAIAAMAREQGVSPVSAAGASVVVQLISVATGIGVVVLTGVRALDQPVAAVIAALLLVVIVAASPRLVPAAIRSLASLTGRDVVVPSIPVRAVAVAAIQTALSWVLYGLAFRLFVEAVLGTAAGPTLSYIAVFAASYIIGFVAVFAPGGAVVRESAMIAAMLRLGLASEADALAVAVASRLWLTVTELIPGLAYLALGKPGAGTNQPTE
jgi:hypothetical protein